jgi:hypothetical protein
VAHDVSQVSNVSDKGYVGIPLVLGHMMNLLREPHINPHATLVTLFMNAVDETRTEQDQISEISLDSASSKRLVKYLPPRSIPNTSTHHPELIKFSYARDHVGSFDHIFDR